MLETIGLFILVSKDISFFTLSPSLFFNPRITDFDTKYNMITFKNIREPRSILHLHDV